MTLNSQKIYLWPICLLLFVACASVPPPVGSLNSADQVISQASAAQPRGIAASSLEQARNYRQLAEQAMVDQDYTQADQYAQQAAAVAQLALAQERVSKAKDLIDNLTERNAQLRRELLIKTEQ